jgi:hypothetical protein
MKSKGKADQAACASNLKEIHKSSMLYEQDNRVFPFLSEESQAYEHLQLLVDSGFADHPKLFICPSGRMDKEAERDEDDNFELEENNCSYAWTNTPKSMSSRGTKLLSADKQFGDMQHEDGLNLIYVGGNVEWVKVDEDSGKTWDDITKGQLTK